MKSFKPVDESLFFSRDDKNDPRLGEISKPKPLAELSDANDNSYVLSGYPDDAGIKINGGRLGASQAPDVIRKYLYKMTPSYLASRSPDEIFDIGNLNLDAELEDRHKIARDAAHTAMAKGYKWISFGGGHDYGYADASAFCETYSPDSKPLVINFDAHLDVRPIDKGLSSGTPFFRLLSEFKDIDFIEIGIQGQCNSRAHVDWLRERGGQILSIEEIRAASETFAVTVLKFLEPYLLKKRPAFISVDIDAFSSSDAPGCSQSWATGFRAEEFFDVYQVLLKRLDVRALSVYEVSPPLDHDDRTSKLAALIAHRYLFQL